MSAATGARPYSLDDMREPAPLITRAEAAAQAEVREVVKALKAIRLRLEGVRASLSVPAYESLRLQDEEEMDLSMEIRSVIECVLNDSLEPAVRDLEAVVALSGEDTED